MNTNLTKETNIPEAVRLAQNLLNHLRNRRTRLANDAEQSSDSIIRELSRADLMLVEAEIAHVEQILAALA